jgi:RNA polymerase sigma factor (sigma-70 family)
VRPWIAQLTRRLCIDRLRANARERPAAEEELFLTEADDTVAMLDEALTLHEALAAAPGHCREILDRFFARDESYKTIGEALDLPSGTIASRISRCLARLRAFLEGRTDGAAPSGVR